MFALLVNGIVMTIEDHRPGGWDHIEVETKAQKSEYKKMLSFQIIVAVVALIAGVTLHASTGN